MRYEILPHSLQGLAHIPHMGLHETMVEDYFPQRNSR